MTMDDFLPYAKQSIDSEDVLEVSKALTSGIITRGERVEAFEKAFAEYCGAKHAVAFSSGSAALVAACHAGQIGPRDRFITTPNTFVATVGAGIHCGANPIFVDIDRSTGNLDLEQVEINLKQPISRGKAVVIPVHFSGIPVDMRRLDRMISHPDCVVIEDAAHALGSTYKEGQKVGSCAYSQMTIFSFHPAKTMTTGEGGMVTTNDDDLNHRLRRFRNNGIERDPIYLEEAPSPWYYEVHEISNNFNFTELQGALGLSQLKRLNSFAAKRRELVQAYRDQLRDFPHLRVFTSELDAQSVFHLLVVQIDFAACKTDRTAVMNKLRDKGIGTQVHYIPVYRHPYFRKKFGDISEYFPQMEGYYSQALSLPLYYDLRLEDVERVVGALRESL